MYYNSITTYFNNKKKLNMKIFVNIIFLNFKKNRFYILNCKCLFSFKQSLKRLHYIVLVIINHYKHQKYFSSFLNPFDRTIKFLNI